MTVQTFLDNIQTLIGDDSSEFEDVLFVAMKEVLSEVQLYTKDRGFKKTATKTLSSGSQTIDISDLDDFQQEISIYYIEDGNKQIIRKRDDVWFNLFYTSSDTATPEYYRIRGNTLEFAALSDDTYTIYIEYLGVEAESIQKTDSFTYTSKVISVLRHGVYWKGYSHREEDKRAAEHFQLYADGLKRLQIEFYRQEQPDMVADYEYET